MNHYPDFPFESFDSTATMVIFLGLGCNNYGTMVLPWMGRYFPDDVIMNIFSDKKESFIFNRFS